MLVMTSGDRGPQGARSRVSEQKEASRIIGAQLLWGHFDDGAIPNGRESVSVVDSAVRDLHADVVYVHAPDDSHQDHVATSLATAAAARRTARILYYQSPSTTKFQPNVFVDVEATVNGKIDALARPLVAGHPVPVRRPRGSRGGLPLLGQPGPHHVRGAVRDPAFRLGHRPERRKDSGRTAYGSGRVCRSRPYGQGHVSASVMNQPPDARQLHRHCDRRGRARRRGGLQRARTPGEGRPLDVRRAARHRRVHHRHRRPRRLPRGRHRRRQRHLPAVLPAPRGLRRRSGALGRQGPVRPGRGRPGVPTQRVAAGRLSQRGTRRPVAGARPARPALPPVPARDHPRRRRLDGRHRRPARAADRG